MINISSLAYSEASVPTAHENRSHQIAKRNEFQPKQKIQSPKEKLRCIKANLTKLSDTSRCRNNKKVTVIWIPIPNKNFDWEFWVVILIYTRIVVHLIMDTNGNFQNGRQERMKIRICDSYSSKWLCGNRDEWIWTNRDLTWWLRRYTIQSSLKGS